jgi:hypothetical protein
MSRRQQKEVGVVGSRGGSGTAWRTFEGIGLPEGLLTWWSSVLGWSWKGHPTPAKGRGSALALAEVGGCEGLRMVYPLWVHV